MGLRCSQETRYIREQYVESILTVEGCSNKNRLIAQFRWWAPTRASRVHKEWKSVGENNATCLIALNNYALRCSVLDNVSWVNCGNGQ